MATATLDVHQLSSYLSLPESTLSSLIETPSTQLANEVLAAVAEKAREHGILRSEKLRLDVELENAVRSAATRTRGLKASVEKGLAQVSELREKLKEAENGRSAVEAELAKFSASASTSTSELEALKSRISSLESSNRDTLSLLDAKSTAHDRLAEELSAQALKTNELRREISALERSLQAANSAAKSAQFRESGLQQEIDLLKRSNDWFETELKTKSAELSKNRKEKGARIAELQRQNEDANSTIDSLRRTEANLRVRVDELTQKADDAFTKVQKLQEEAGREQESYRIELETQKRLVTLQERSAKSAQERLQDIQNEVEQIKDDAVDEAGRLRAEMETERAERDAAEHRVTELEVVIERMEADARHFRNTPSLPGTPRRPVNGISSPGPEGASPGLARMKGGLSFTQMYSEYNSAKLELEAEKRRTQTLTTTMDEMIQMLEAKQPELAEVQAEARRLESDRAELAIQLEEVGKDRDKEKKEARKWQGQVSGLQREGDLLRQQLRDLSTQVRVLLTELHSRDTGLDSLDEAEQREFERSVRVGAESDALEGQTATGRLISQRLTTFKSIEDLHEQHTTQLRMLRELGDKMEGEEARKKEDQHVQDLEELRSLREKVEKYKDEMKTMVIKSQSYVKERDMFRRMLQHKGKLDVNGEAPSEFGESIAPGNLAASTGIDAQHVAAMTQAIKEQQQYFDSYREESSINQRALIEERDSLSRDKGSLQAEIARASSQLTLARERYEMLQANMEMLKKENAELQKQKDSLSEGAAKQDLRTQQVTEDLIEMKAAMDSMRNEAANLKAEKELWKRIEKRLIEDNESLMNEKSRLNTLITSVQNLQNERELSDSETRRKLEAQVQSLESDLQSTRRKLGDEVEEAKQAARRREFETAQHQKNLDDLRALLGQTREELASAKTTKDHLQARVDELTIELKSAEERAQILQPRPTPRPAAATTVAVDEDALSREQELATEVSELRRDLELSKAALENAKAQIEQFKAISQAAEDDLQAMNESHDQYREDQDKVLEQKDREIGDLKQRLQDITEELTSANSEVSRLRDAHSEAIKSKDEQLAALEVEISRLKDEDDRHATTAHFYQEDLKTQAEIAQQAQQNYENELVKHAEAAKDLQKIRGEYNTLRSEMVELRTTAEAAQAALSQNEASWDETKGRYDAELAELRARGENVTAQNKILHQQLETVTTQISALQKQRTTLAEGGENGEGNTQTTSDQTVEELRELVRYIREGKDIVDVQLELSNRESKRLKQQLDYTQTQLEETRLKLDQLRTNQAEQSTPSMTHTELIEKINELNLYRESTVTLRNEARTAQSQLAEQSKRVEELISQIQPLQARIDELEQESEAREAEMKQLQENRDFYQQRNQNLLQKYERVDPAEMEELKTQLAAIKVERENLAAELAGVPAQVEKAKEEASEELKAKETLLAELRERQQKIVAQAKERNRVQTATINGKAAEAEKLVSEKGELEQQLASLRQELESAKVERDQAISAAAAPAPQPPVSSDPAGQNGTSEASVPYVTSDEDTAKIQGLESRLETAEELLQQESSNAQKLQEDNRAHHAKVLELEETIAVLQRRLSEKDAELLKLQASAAAAAAAGGAAPVAASSGADEEVVRLQAELEKTQDEYEQLKTDVIINGTIASGPPEDGTSVEAQVLEKIETLRTTLNTEYGNRVAKLEADYKRKANSMRDSLNKKLREAKEQLKPQIDTELKKALDELRGIHEQEIQTLKAQQEALIEEYKKKEEAQAQKQASSEDTPATGEAVTQAKDVVKQEHTATAPTLPVSEWELSDNQARELIKSNQTLHAIMKQNISTQVKKAREESEQKLKDAQTRAEKEKEQAITMAEQRQKVKLSMAEGKARGLAAKVGIVESAVAETPQRPVAEVWEIAKAAKPPGPPGPGLGQQTPAPANVPGLQRMAPAPSVPNPFSSTPPQARPAPASFGQPTQIQTIVPSQMVNNQMQPQMSVPATAFSQTQPQQAVIQNNGPAAAVFTAQPGVAPVQAGPSTQAANHGLPVKPPLAQNHPNAGTGPAALRGIMAQGQSGIPQPGMSQSGIPQSGIPRGGGAGQRGGRGGRGGQGAQGQGPNQNIQGVPHQQAQGQRGQSGIPRGGRGRGRGAAAQQQQQQQPIQTSGLPHAQSSNSPGGGRGALNAGARQFVPGGNKRQRDEGSGGPAEVGNTGKKLRSSGGPQ